jgi:hypothetical protein
MICRLYATILILTGWSFNPASSVSCEQPDPQASSFGMTTCFQTLRLLGMILRSIGRACS